MCQQKSCRLFSVFLQNYFRFYPPPLRFRTGIFSLFKTGNICFLELNVSNSAAFKKNNLNNNYIYTEAHQILSLGLFPDSKLSTRHFRVQPVLLCPTLVLPNELLDSFFLYNMLYAKCNVVWHNYFKLENSHLIFQSQNS